MLDREKYLAGFATAVYTVEEFLKRGHDPAVMISNELEMMKDPLPPWWSDWDRGYADGKLASIGL